MNVDRLQINGLNYLESCTQMFALFFKSYCQRMQIKGYQDQVNTLKDKLASSELRLQKNQDELTAKTERLDTLELESVQLQVIVLCRFSKFHSWQEARIRIAELENAKDALEKQSHLLLSSGER